MLPALISPIIEECLKLITGRTFSRFFLNREFLGGCRRLRRVGWERGIQRGAMVGIGRNAWCASAGRVYAASA
jgi:hypothetical protein